MLISLTLLFSSLMVQDPQTTAKQRPDMIPARHTDLSRELAKMAIDSPLVVGHRGDPVGYPENTLAAFRSAIDQGADLIELDFRQSSDGHLVVIHDRTVDRTTDGRARLNATDIEVSTLSLEQLSKLDAGNWQDSRHRGLSIPTLDAALDLVQEQAITMIEHKAGEAGKLIDLLRRKSLLGRVIVQSFDWEWLRELHRAEPKIMIAALGDGPCDAKKLAELQGTGACMLHWRYQDLSLEAIFRLKAEGYLLCAFTIDAELGLIGAAAAGLDAVTTNRPGRMQALIASGALRRRR